MTVSVRKAMQDVRKAGQYKSPLVCLTAPEGFTVASGRCPKTIVHIKDIVHRTA